MAYMNRNYPAVLIHGNGNFNENIQRHLNLASENCPIAAVSVLGVQSTGKSTLLNECFSSGFQVMDASQGMHQTTKGIWITKWASSNCPHKILVIDTEGNDGSERGGDDRFEKQATLFALAISNTVIFNMKCENVNLHNGGSRPLLRTVFEVMVRKFNTPRKINLLFVLRDKNPQSPLETLKEQLIKGIREIWREMSNAQAQGNGAIASLEAYFNMELMAMPHYSYQKEQFIREVGILRQRIVSYSTSGRLGIAASGFIDYAKTAWGEIKEDKILNLQLNRITIAEVYCHRIAEENYQNFRKNKSWIQIKKDAESGIVVKGFGNNVSRLIDAYLSGYDKETQYFDETKRQRSRNQLTERLLRIVEPTYLSVVERMRVDNLANFKDAAKDELKSTGELVAMSKNRFIVDFRNQLQDAAIKQAEWDHDSKELTKLQSEIDSVTDEIRHVNELLQQKKKDQRGFWLKAIGGNLLLSTASIIASITIGTPLVTFPGN